MVRPVPLTTSSAPVTWSEPFLSGLTVSGPSWRDNGFMSPGAGSPLAAKPAEQAANQSGFFAVLYFVQNLRKVGVFHSLFEPPEEREHSRRGVFIEPGEEAVERALERLLRIEPESDHVA